ncbi:leucine-rich_repeat domain-containing protein [Hexamita inflata]|uniref:Leucine-rich_repeat domain-containing protein n=1 Tax=Hexamita inflata TaxID=28002 RepID=A0ABP1J602_9EUKA
MQQLTILEIDCCDLQNVDALKALVNLNELELIGNEGIDITSIQYLNQLTGLYLGYCALKDVNALKTLMNLKELSLYANSGIDITSLQYLKQLVYLDIGDCGLFSLDTLRTLLNLQELYIQENEIIYIHPIEQLKRLSIVNAENNKIIDINKLQLHNLKQFNIDFQEVPTEGQLIYANKLRSINTPIISLKKLVYKHKKAKFRSVQTILENTCVKQIHNNYQKFVQLLSQLFKRLNECEECQ